MLGNDRAAASVLKKISYENKLVFASNDAWFIFRRKVKSQIIHVGVQKILMQYAKFAVHYLNMQQVSAEYGPCFWKEQIHRVTLY
jgi:hypothetical protein